MNQKTQGSSGSTCVTVNMNNGTKQVINVSTIPVDERIALRGSVNGKPVQSATICRPNGSRDLILSTTRNPHQGIAITLNEVITISQNASLLAKKFGGPDFSIDSVTKV